MITTLFLAAALSTVDKVNLAAIVSDKQTKPPVVRMQKPVRRGYGSFPPCSKGERISNSLGTVWSGSQGYTGSAAECPVSSKVVEE